MEKQKQFMPAKSSAEAEYRAMNIYIVIIVLQFAANPVFHEKTKHFEIELFFLREKVSTGVVKTVKVKSADNVADLFTKGTEESLKMVRTLFWKDIWIGEANLKQNIQDFSPWSHAKEQPSLDHSFRRFPRGGFEGEQYRDLCSITSKVLLPQTLDRWVWSLNASGDFSVSSVCNLIDDAFLPKSDVPTMWIKLVP
ncbi:hypothetical protein Tco_1221483 [Tanacetum coccineum]